MKDYWRQWRNQYYAQMAQDLGKTSSFNYDEFYDANLGTDINAPGMGFNDMYQYYYGQQYDCGEK